MLRCRPPPPGIGCGEPRLYSFDEALVEPVLKGFLGESPNYVVTHLIAATWTVVKVFWRLLVRATAAGTSTWGGWRSNGWDHWRLVEMSWFSRNYEEYGEDFVDMLDGIFSFVLLDTRDNSFIVARDAIGVTFLYIGWGFDGSVWISSELKGLNDDSADMFLQAVTKRLMTDVPFGVLLSGGLDSSLVASITTKYLAGTKAAKQWGAQPHSFCVGLEGKHSYVSDVKKDESLGVKMVISGEGSDEIFGGYLYFHKAPNKDEFHLETCRKIKALHQYDCLRANKATSAWGLEARVPFLEKEFINVAMSIDPEAKMVTDKMMFNASNIFPHNTPTTKEAYYYWMIFERFFPQNSAKLTVPGGASVACSTAKAVE
ncbi:Asparagine synthetase 1 [Hibiscus syriacus]|uniref:Asparagine synthetase 1 n=1 Tax=Hibiscus syriacus TaxID=106335 RepID=A0A6A3D2B9_HIBSY|nr:Asparagine synthetase 1 [Hibiscus syriacus]